MRSSLNFITIICLCSMRVSSLDKFPGKFVAGQKGSSVELSCDKATKSPVTWKLDDTEDLDTLVDLFNVSGSKLTILNLDSELTGNFTCWSEGKEVDYTFVLLDMSDTITGSPVSCTAETFNCTSTVSCSMSEKGYIDFRLRDESNNLLTRPTDGKFNLTHTTNPFAEEAKPTVVIGEAVSVLNNYFRIHYSFYIRDIIRPGCPRVSVLKTGSVDMLDVNPPATWTLPLSYYPLQHEIEFQQRTDGKISNLFLLTNNNNNKNKTEKKNKKEEEEEEEKRKKKEEEKRKKKEEEEEKRKKKEEEKRKKKKEEEEEKRKKKEEEKRKKKEEEEEKRKKKEEEKRKKKEEEEEKRKKKKEEEEEKRKKKKEEEEEKRKKKKKEEEEEKRKKKKKEEEEEKRKKNEEECVCV
ncbi:hypothetical protein QTP86_028264 [Hemibagrus guttatus]|nr:hypothetical protein QTP86_028264 [Hemibagrus guttatus]